MSSESGVTDEVHVLVHFSVSHIHWVCMCVYGERVNACAWRALNHKVIDSKTALNVWFIPWRFCFSAKYERTFAVSSIRRCLWISMHTRFFICKYKNQTNQSDAKMYRCQQTMKMKRTNNIFFFGAICSQQLGHYLDDANKINAQKNNEKIIIKSISVCFHYIIAIILRLLFIFFIPFF